LKVELVNATINTIKLLKIWQEKITLEKI